jgi:hypothetical protein
MNKQYQTEKVGKHFVLRDKENKAFYSKILLEDTPCNGCIHVSTCGKERKACYAFALYVHNGSVDWSVPRAPTRRIYSRVMWFDDPSLIRQINKEMRERNAHA